MSSKSKEFLSSDSDDSTDEPKQKKKKTEKKLEKKESKEGPKKGPNGEYMFEISKMRFATVSEFKGKVMVGIREFYEKDDKLLPGRKGISLSMEQWESFKKHIDDIDECVKKF